MNKRVLITGATGFVGRNCVDEFVQRGYQVDAIGSSRVGDSQANVNWYQADLFDPAAVKSLTNDTAADTLVHLAWNAKPGQAYASPENYAWVTASLDLVQRFVESGGKRVVVAGSCYEYDQLYGWCREKHTPLEPATLYGVCKNALRQMLEAYCQAKGVSFSWPRIFFLYGPHENPKRLASSVVLSLLEDRQAECSHGRQLRDFMYAGDLADALATLTESDLQGAINLGSGAPITIAQLVTLIGEQTGRPELVALGALPARPSEALLIAADVARQQNELGWTPKHSHTEAIDKTIAWWQSQLQEA